MTLNFPLFVLWLSVKAYLIGFYFQLRYTDTLFTEQEVRFAQKLFITNRTTLSKVTAI